MSIKTVASIPADSIGQALENLTDARIALNSAQQELHRIQQGMIKDLADTCQYHFLKLDEGMLRRAYRNR
jgi:hypothetical protein